MLRTTAEAVKAREERVSALFAEGLSRAQIAQRLGLRPYTVAGILQRLGLKGRRGVRGVTGTPV